VSSAKLTRRYEDFTQLNYLELSPTQESDVVFFLGTVGVREVTCLDSFPFLGSLP